MKRTAEAASLLRTGNRHQHDRTKCLLSLLKSIKMLDQKIDVIIGDDGESEHEMEARNILGSQLVSYLHLTVDSGTGYGRNRIVNEAERLGYNYYIMSDDDYIIDNPMLLTKLAQTLVSNKNTDVIAPVRCESERRCELGNTAF